MNTIIKYTLIISVAALTLTGCRKSLDDAGINPNNPTTVTPNVLLTAGQIYTGYTIGGDIGRFAGIMDQHIAGVDRQQAIFARYNMSPGDFDNVWQNAYLAMYNLKDLYDTAARHDYNYYAGVAKIMSAYSLGVYSDMWGDLPYTTAFRGSDNITNPATFDKQSDIYNNLQTMLDTGIARMSAAKPGNLVPGSDDLVYGGDPARWTRLAYALKARFYLHTRKADPGALAKATAALASAMVSANDDAYIKFVGNSDKSANPWYQYTQQRAGDLSFSSGNVAALMIAHGDPRLAAFIDTSSNALGTYYAPRTAGVQIMTYAEQRFIAAEIAMVGGDMSTAALAANDGALTSVGYFYGAITTSADTAWMMAHAAETASSITLEKIMTQKYIALFLNPESYTDWRRTGYPTLTPLSGALLPTIPRRLLYPESELERNKNTPKGVLLTDKLWWDK